MNNGFKSLFTAGLLALGLTGCLTSNDDEITFDDVKLENASLTIPSSEVSTKILGEISSGEAISSIDFMVTKDGAAVPSTEVKVTSTAPGSDADSWDLGDIEEGNAKVVVSSSAKSGDYKITIKVTAGDITGEKTLNLTLTGGTTVATLVEKTLVMGAQDAAQGSAADLDSFVVYTSSSAKTHAAHIDIYFQSGSSGTKATLLSPAEAKADGYDLIESWTVHNATKFVEVTAPWASLNTQAAIDAAYTASASTAGSQLELSGGEVIIVKTEKDNHVAIKVESVSSQTRTAVLTIKGYK